MTTPETVRIELKWTGDAEATEGDLAEIKRQLDRFNGRVVKQTRGRRIAFPDMFAWYEHDVINLIASLAGAGVGAAFLKGIRDIVIAWMRTNAERKIIIRVGKKKIEIHGMNDIDSAIAALEKIPEELSETKRNRKPTPRSPPQEKRIRRGI
jgi:hypothetical protein